MRATVNWRLDITHWELVQFDPDPESFMAAMRRQFPDLVDELDDPTWAGLLHLEIACLARWTQTAIERDDRQAVRQVMMFVDRGLRGGDPRVENAVAVSFLENLTLTTGPGAIGDVDPQREWVIELMSSRVKSCYDDLVEHWRTLGS